MIAFAENSTIYTQYKCKVHTACNFKNSVTVVIVGGGDPWACGDTEYVAFSVKRYAGDALNEREYFECRQPDWEPALANCKGADRAALRERPRQLAGSYG